MPRPRRSGEPAKPFTIYLTPQAIGALRSSAWAVNMSPGAFVESLLDGPEPFAPPVVSPTSAPTPVGRKHSYENKGWGKVCKNCGHVEAKGDVNPSCPG